MMQAVGFRLLISFLMTLIILNFLFEKTTTTTTLLVPCHPQFKSAIFPVEPLTSSAKQSFKLKEDVEKDCNKWLSKEFRGGRFQSQFRQDFVLYHLFFRDWFPKHRNPVYVDLAAFDPRDISNSFFYDACLGWKGICIEADPLKAALFNSSTRGCSLVNKCISAEAGQKVYFSSGRRNGGSRIIANGNAQDSIELECTTLANVLADYDIHEIDMLSLDIEGAEAMALSSVDWSKTKIHVMVTEDARHIRKSAHPTVVAYEKILKDNGYVRVGNTSIQTTDAIW
eukprot:CAMPEP_0167761704 /NCGR_PEP_ID=MMETSP0110_2-20121227/12330_1 /TAXON_ID=629695 /ORGANISM="Gymnochlora sp., Strain CCMP2014" /LENGTH=282 /DNA_ID=CAMNT_0007648437 /DNA_START=70 /DNA_END=915 /DNA_ORIENTATION=-